ncbi:hypothetical protein LX36DRAFT_416958 [Colletotrichum falcatum]|nr:hypothetical protein LX36DRAFT_416958 [Colletotrichum falcatum]
MYPSSGLAARGTTHSRHRSRRGPRGFQYWRRILRSPKNSRLLLYLRMLRLRSLCIVPSVAAPLPAAIHGCRGTIRHNTYQSRSSIYMSDGYHTRLLPACQFPFYADDVR